MLVFILDVPLVNILFGFNCCCCYLNVDTILSILPFSLSNSDCVQMSKCQPPLILNRSSFPSLPPHHHHHLVETDLFKTFKRIAFCMASQILFWHVFPLTFSRRAEANWHYVFCFVCLFVCLHVLCVLVFFFAICLRSES